MVECIFNLGELSLLKVERLTKNVILFYIMAISFRIVAHNANIFLRCCPQHGKMFHTVAYNADHFSAL
jgi:hypothetical protein